LSGANTGFFLGPLTNSFADVACVDDYYNEYLVNPFGNEIMAVFYTTKALWLTGSLYVHTMISMFF